MIIFAVLYTVTLLFSVMDLIANYESDNEEVKTPQKLKAYSAEFKLKVVKHAREISKHSASRKFGISRSCVQDWVKQEAKLHQIKQVFSTFLVGLLNLQEFVACGKI